jgi:hypothetical protein
MGSPLEEALIVFWAVWVAMCFAIFAVVVTGAFLMGLL